MEQSTETVQQTPDTGVEPQTAPPTVYFALCQECQKNDVCEVWKAIERLKQSLQQITGQYDIEVTGQDIQIFSCKHGLWNNKAVVA